MAGKNACLSSNFRLDDDDNDHEVDAFSTALTKCLFSVLPAFIRKPHACHWVHVYAKEIVPLCLFSQFEIYCYMYIFSFCCELYVTFIYPYRYSPVTLNRLHDVALVATIGLPVTTSIIICC